MDVSLALGVALIVLTGAFGILGLLTEHRDPATHKVTKWGIVSLSGIILSTVIGAVVAIRSESEKKVAQAAETALNQQIERNSANAAKTIGRLERQIAIAKSKAQHSLVDAIYTIQFNLPCGEVAYKKLCQDAVIDDVNYVFPVDPDIEIGLKSSMDTEASFYRAIYQYQVIAHRVKPTAKLFLNGQDYSAAMNNFSILQDFSGRIVESDDDVASLEDLTGRVIFVISCPLTKGAKPPPVEEVTITVKGGAQATFAGGFRSYRQPISPEYGENQFTQCRVYERKIAADEVPHS